MENYYFGQLNVGDLFYGLIRPFLAVFAGVFNSVLVFEDVAERALQTLGDLEGHREESIVCDRGKVARAVDLCFLHACENFIDYRRGFL